MNIILDLDGTLVSTRRRIHTLFCDLIEDEIPSERFWNLKFKGFSNDEILKFNYNFSDKNINLFLERWMKEIESDMYLNMDEIIPGVIKFLDKHSNKDLYICSARQSIKNTIKQLEKLNIYNFFKEIFITEQKITKDKILQNSNIKFESNDWLVSDTGHDIKVGKLLGIKTCAVLSGSMCKDQLKKYNPDQIVDNISYLNP